MSILLSPQSRADFPLLALKPVALQQLHSPTTITHAGDGSGRLFVCDQPGQIRIVQGGMLRPQPFLDLSARAVPQTTGYSERGLLGLAFHPGYADPGSPGHGRFYVYYSKPSVPASDPPPPHPGDPVNHLSLLAEYRVSAADPNVADPASERVLLAFTQPQSNHNGGQLAFGPDGMLYLGTGDGGSSDDNNAGHTGGSSSKPNGILGNAQDKTNLLGKILRLDPLGGNGPAGQYGIPADNPFVGAGGGVREEIYAFGLRNPWRFSFDRRPGGTMRLFCGDVGQGKVEEIDLIVRGGNYGWRVKEGNIDHDASAPTGGGPLLPPVAEYAHFGQSVGNPPLPQLGLSVTGGFVYRGTAIPALQGKYLFGDYGATSGSVDSRLMGLEESAPLSGSFTLVPAVPLIGGNPIAGRRILCLGEDEQGELYLGTKTNAGVLQLDQGLPAGGIYRLVAAATTTATIAPARDNSIYADNPSNSNGKGDLFAGRIATGSVRRALLAFDLSGFPANATVANAELKLHVVSAAPGSPGPTTATLHQLTEAWGEGSSSATGTGAAAATNDATWSHRLWPANTWGTQGGSFAASPSASFPLDAAGPCSVNAPGLAADVQAWLAAPATNFGWILRGDETVNSTAKRLASRENATAGQRPQLALTLATAPPPSHFEMWLATHFPANLVGQYVDPLADLDGDTLVNLIEYACGFSPRAADAATGFSVAKETSAGGAGLLATFRRDPAATDLLYQLQASGDMAHWTTIASSAGGAPATGANNGTVESDEAIAGDPAFRLVTVRESLPPGTGAARFVRLAVSRAP